MKVKTLFRPIVGLAAIALISCPAFAQNFVVGDAGFNIPGNNWPGGEAPGFAIDGVGQKYLNFGQQNTGFAVTPSVGASVATSLTLWSANDAIERDPAFYEVWGSNEPAPAGFGAPNTLLPITAFTAISTGEVVLPETRNAGGDAALDVANSFTVDFDNSVAYSSYLVVFPDVRDPSSANSMQIADVQLFDSAGDGIFTPGDPIVGGQVLAEPDLNTIGGDDFGTVVISGELDVVRGPDQLVQGLAQWWYNGNKRNNQDFFNAAREGDTTDLTNPSGAAFTTPDTWWGGNGDRVISGIALDRYPDPALAGDRFAGTNNENYGVRLFGEIFIPEDGVYLLRDGIDDYTMLAMDLEGDGLNEDDLPLANEDAPIGDLIIHDDDWANWNGGSNDGPNGPFGIAEFEDIDNGGSWREIEIWMSEGGGGDAGIFYMANEDDDDLNLDQWDAAGALDAEQRDMYLIPPENLRASVPGDILSGTSTVKLEGGNVEHVFQVSSDLLDSDHVIVRDAGGEAVSVIDLSDATIRIEAEGDLVAGDEWVLFGADELVGEDSVTWVVDDINMWDFSGLTNDGEGAHRIRYTGGLVSNPLDNNGDGVVDGGDLVNACGAGNVAELLEALGTVPGDLDGNGVVEFPDFLTLSGNFNQEGVEYAGGDIDCSGVVEFPDFLSLSGNFGAGSAAASVPEPATAGLLAAAFAFIGLARRRRR